MNDQVLFNQQYADFFVKHFNWAVFENEAKWYANEPERGKITYEKADAMLNFADRHQLPVRARFILGGRGCESKLAKVTAESRSI